MKRTIILALSAALLATMGTAQSPQKEDKAIKRTYKVSNFAGIQNNVGINITYRQGSSYSVSVSGKKKLLDLLLLRVKDNRLVISNKNKAKQWSGRLNMTITAPRIENISNSGAMTFQAGDVEVSDFRLRNSGSLKLRAGTVRCSTADVANSGSASVHFNIYSTGEVKLVNSGSNYHEGDVRSSLAITHRNSGSETFKGNLTGKSIKTSNTGAAIMKSALKSDNLNLRNSGQLNATLQFKGETADVANQGSGKVSIGIDCTDLKATNGGVATMTLTGRADNTTIDGTGVSNINTQGLNKF